MTGPRLAGQHAGDRTGSDATLPVIEALRSAVRALGGGDASAARRHALSYGQALSGQLVLSAFSFGLNLYLLRALSLADYGAFAFAQVCAQLAANINGALVATPLMVSLPALAGAVARRRLEGLMVTVNAALIAAFVAVFALLALASGLGFGGALAFALFVAATAMRGFSRGLAFARQRPAVALRGDLCLVGCSMVAVATAVLAEGAARLGSVIGALALAQAITAAAELLLLAAPMRLRLAASTLRRYRRIWRQARWALVGAATTVLQAQAHTLLVTLAAGPAAFAPLAAAQVLFGPVGVAVNAVQNVLRPQLAAAIGRGDRRAVLVTSVAATALLGGAVIALGIGLALAWPLIAGALYADKYAAEPMAAIALGCGAIALCRALYTPPSSLLQALQRFRALALGTVGGAIISILGVAACLAVLSPPWTLAGVACGEACFALYAFRRAIADGRGRW